MKADGRCSAPRRPSSEHRVQALPHLAEVGEPSIQVGALAQHQTVNVGTRQAPGTLDRDDLLDLVQAEAKPLRLPHESQQVQGIRAVHAVARLGAPRRRQDACLFVQAQGLPAGTALLRDLTDQQPVSRHDKNDRP
jgi:hypothetical protein